MTNRLKKPDELFVFIDERHINFSSFFSHQIQNYRHVCSGNNMQIYINSLILVGWSKTYNSFCRQTDKMLVLSASWQRYGIGVAQSGQSSLWLSCVAHFERSADVFADRGAL